MPARSPPGRGVRWLRSARVDPGKTIALADLRQRFGWRR
jgi:hypothetical protein